MPKNIQEERLRWVVPRSPNGTPYFVRVFLCCNVSALMNIKTSDIIMI